MYGRFNNTQGRIVWRVRHLEVAEEKKVGNSPARWKKRKKMKERRLLFFKQRTAENAKGERKSAAGLL